MGLYVETMCDAPSAERLNCVSDDGDNPQGATIGEAKEEARKQGWRLKGARSAICEQCWKQGFRHER
jgi:hypothetical protein